MRFMEELNRKLSKNIIIYEEKSCGDIKVAYNKVSFNYNREEYNIVIFVENRLTLPKNEPAGYVRDDIKFDYHFGRASCRKFNYIEITKNAKDISVEFDVFDKYFRRHFLDLVNVINFSDDELRLATIRRNSNNKGELRWIK